MLTTEQKQKASKRQVAYARRNKEKVYKTNKKYRELHPERMKEIHRGWLKSMTPQELSEMRKKHALKKGYGITPEQYDAIVLAQDRRCPICLEPLPLLSEARRKGDVDHCHSTGVVRGILHNRCNRLLSCCQDDIQILYRAANYLRSAHDYVDAKPSVK